MGLRINTNIQSLSAQRALSGNRESQNRALEHLASGSRINRAGEDAAGLAISERLKGNIRSMKQASRNASDGISMIQVAEGGMNEIGNILIRMRELSIQTASDTIGDVERGFVDKEIQSLKDEVNRISSSTEFNGMKLLDGSAPVLDVQVGIHNGQDNRITYPAGEQKVTPDALGIVDVSGMTKEQSQENLGKIDFAINRLNENRSTLGAAQNRLQSTINNLAIYNENLEAANSRIRDADIAHETTELTKYNILQQANVSVLAQANQNSMMALKLLG